MPLSSLTYEDLRLVERFQDLCKQLHVTYRGSASTDGSMVTLCTDQEYWPVWGENQPLFTGTVSECFSYLMGIIGARMYDKALGISSEKTRAKEENSCRNRILLKKIKGSEVDNRKESDDNIPF